MRAIQQLNWPYRAWWQANTGH